ncbi:hypothetical protein [Nocardia sp. NPDC004860]|uniref:DUF6968 family protein n=1 Tax=Nocardia sp. NPDC004860 TaxID=3154557 RepID=UPI0033B83BA3
MTASDLPAESLLSRFGEPDITLEAVVEIGRPKPWPGTPHFACPYRIGETTGYAAGVDAAEALRSAVQTVAEILQRQD